MMTTEATEATTTTTPDAIDTSAATTEFDEFP